MASYKKTIEELRAARDQRTKSNPLSWLNLAGLFPLEEGQTGFGRDETNGICLSGFPLAHCGYFSLHQDQVTFHPAPKVKFNCNHPGPETRPLITDRNPDPDLIDIGTITLKIIVRGQAIFVRAWDRESPVGRQFNGFIYFPIREEYRIKAKYIRFDRPKVVQRVDIIGTESEGRYLGLAQFSLNGVDCELTAEKDGDKLLFHFTDSTSRVSTYGGGRKFSVLQPDGDQIILDFNLAENWPCAYTPFATCPMVPPENRLSVKIEAGEKKYLD
ncbi:MAG: DUF1684 domain-containing protein [Chloroflexi bacterium]|nr:DUF1684 domain-containing protein [Chloroflexota bacterium]